MTDSDHIHCDFSHSSRMQGYLQKGLLRKALASTQPQASCGDSCAELLKMLQLEMLSYLLDNLGEPEPEYLARPDVQHVFSHLMAMESLLPNCLPRTERIFDDIVRAYYPDNVKTFFDTFTVHIHDDTHRLKFWKNVCSAMERCLHDRLAWMNAGTIIGYQKQRLKNLQKKFCDLIQAMAIPLHDDTVPAYRYGSRELHRSDVEHCALFTAAVKQMQVPEALLLYDTGAVGNKELRRLAKDSDVQKMLKSEKDNSVLAVFLRKVLNKPRTLQSLATMQVSRLLWRYAPGDKEKRARDLGLLDIDVERVLLRRQCGRYRAALKQADDEDKAGAS